MGVLLIANVNSGLYDIIYNAQKSQAACKL